MDEQSIANIRSRIERCRRLAADTTDDRAAKILRDMANEGEVDLARMLAEEEDELVPGERQERPDGKIGERHSDQAN